jgi:hypothetical protein
LLGLGCGGELRQQDARRGGCGEPGGGVVSPAYFEELRYTTEEWTSALVRNDGGGHRLVPVQIEPCPVPSLLGPLVRVELFDVDEAEAARRLLAAARGPARPDGKPVFPGRPHAGSRGWRKRSPG